MTAKELIEALGKFPPDTGVVISLHSEYVDVETVEPIEGYNNGGYVSRAYSPEGKLKCRTFLVIS